MEFTKINKLNYGSFIQVHTLFMEKILSDSNLQMIDDTGDYFKDFLYA